MKRPSFFEDVMIKGDFKLFEHKHHFKAVQNGTIVIDELVFETPYGFFGSVFNRLYLTAYLRNLLHKRNQIIKSYAETNKWKVLLEH